ncbi:MAG: SDR family NAD(P)-dependent oxidoreductase [Myxococcales bacterium]|nr:MAG: SDR family NAD(P)-dependent oxidoreductase [Myxococcales bacterium]
MTTRPFAGKHVLVTGGSMGIGLATARQLLAAGAEVTIAARREGPLAAARDELGGGERLRTLVLDVADADAVRAALPPLLAAHPVDILINNAGVTMPGRFLELGERHYRELMDINYFGAVNLCRAVLPSMVARGGGHVVNVGSLLSVMGIYGYSAYCASKFALLGFSESLRAELWPHNVRVSILLPPDTDTPQHTFELPLLPPETRAIAGTVTMLPADTVAASLLRGIARGDFEIIPPGPSRFTVLAQRWVPGLVRWFCDRAQRKVRPTA